MAIKYEITRWDSSTAMKAREYVVCGRAPKAHDELYRLVYEMLSADAMLDRPVALRLASQVMNCKVAPPARGEYRTEKFNLHDNGFGPYVEFRATRV